MARTKEHEDLASKVRGILYSKTKEWGEKDYQLKNNLGSVDLLMVSNFRGKLCLNIYEIKTGSELLGKKRMRKDKLYETVKQLILYTGCLELDEKYDECEYFKRFLVIDEKTWSSRSFYKKEVKSILKQYYISLYTTTESRLKLRLKCPPLKRGVKVAQ